MANAPFATASDPDTVEHLVRPADPECSALQFALDQIGFALSTDTHPPRRSLPEVATELLQLTRNPKADALAIERVVCRDPFVSAQVLSIANSALYAPRTAVLSVREAAVRMGMDAVRDVAMLVITTSRMFRVVGLEKQTLILCNRAVVTAVAARKMAQQLGANTDYAFLAALLHDVGHLLIMEEAGNQGLLTKKVLGSPDLMRVLLQQCARYHQEVGAAACRTWKLPEATVQAALYHHRFRHEGKHYLVANLMAAADLIADALGLGTQPLAVDPDHPTFRSMGLKPETIASIVAETRDVSASLGVPV